MKEKIQKLLEEIRIKKEELKQEYMRLRAKYGFKIKGKKIIWPRGKITEFKKKKHKIFENIRFREIISIPFIYIMLFPAFMLDLCLFIYQQTALRLYKIPLVRRSDYIVFDRKDLAYLNGLEKINCMYCSYFNGLMQYAVEVAGRTEKYWCPIKHVRKKYGEHNREEKFAEYGDVEGFREAFRSNKEFNILLDNKKVGNQINSSNKKNS